MQPMRFTWNLDKAETNLRKHGVSFEEAQTVFYDENAVEFYDDEHSEWEERFLLLGLSSKLRLLIICHAYREESGLIRLISARKANQEEAPYYYR
jgi:uncharacterized protein